MNDAGLVVEARAGNVKAFGAIYDRHAGGIYDFLRLVTGDDALAREVLHDTFVVAGARLLQLPQPSKLRPWLYAIARHRALHELRRRRRWRRKGRKRTTTAGRRSAATRPRARRLRRNRAAVVPVGQPSPGDERAEVSRAIAEVLSPKERVVLELHVRQGLDGKELAETLGVKPGQASGMARRLRERAEREVGLRVLTRTGPKECPELAKILADRGGRLRRRARRRVLRHVDLCPTCRERRRKVAAPLALLSALPPAPPPLAVRELVLGHVEPGSHKGRAWRASRGGFPPPMVRPGQRRVSLGAAAAAVVLVAVAAVLLVRRDGDDTQQVATEGSPTTLDFPMLPDELPPAADDPSLMAPPDGLLGGADDGGAGGGAGGSGRSGGSSRGGGGGGGSGSGSGGGAGAGGEGASGGGTETGQPSLGRVAVQPAQIVEDDGRGGCGRVARSITARVIATPSDAAAVRSMSVSWGGPRSGSADMVPNGEGGYEAVIGPFGLGTVDAAKSVDVSVTVKSVDTGGKSVEHATSFTLRSCD